jgi:hypothetical protein
MLQNPETKKNRKYHIIRIPSYKSAKPMEQKQLSRNVLVHRENDAIIRPSPDLNV